MSGQQHTLALCARAHNSYSYILHPQNSPEAGRRRIARAAASGLRPARAVSLWWKGHHAEAAVLWQAELDDGSASAEASGGVCDHSALRMAYCRRYGCGIQADESMALELYRLAAHTHGNAIAMWKLAIAHRYGTLGLARDDQRFLGLLRLSAESGFCKLLRVYVRMRAIGNWKLVYEPHYREDWARQRIGLVIERGELGAQVSLKEALAWYEKADKQRPGL